MLLIESTQQSDINEIANQLQPESYKKVQPRHFDGSQTFQIIIDIAEVTLPAAIAALSTYLVSRRTDPNIKIVFKPDDKTEIKISGKLGDKKLNDNQLYREIERLIVKKLKKK